MFESGSSSEGVLRQIPQVLPALLKAALNPADTGGKLVDTISTSTVSCEAEWTPAEINAMQAQLRRAASLGVAVFAAAGDAGSLGSYLYDGVLTCVGWPVDENSTAADWPGLSPGVDYPGSSPEVTSVGGTELQINGVVPAAGVPPVARSPMRSCGTSSTPTPPRSSARSPAPHLSRPTRSAIFRRRRVELAFHGRPSAVAALHTSVRAGAQARYLGAGRVAQFPPGRDRH